MTSARHLRRLWVHLALGLLLLFAQQHATQHWLSHAIEAAQAKKPIAPAATHCDACDGLFAFGAALPALPRALALHDEFHHVQPQHRLTTPLLVAAPVAYLSRAPPDLG